jgi:hypothetical protein
MGGKSLTKLGTGIKGVDYVGIDFTDTFNQYSKNSLDLTFQMSGLGAEMVLTFDGIVPTIEEFYLLGGPFAKSLISKVEDKFTTAIALGGCISVDQKLDTLLPILFEYMAMSTPELIIEVSEKLEKEGYRIINGQLVLYRQKKK